VESQLSSETTEGSAGFEAVAARRGPETDQFQATIGGFPWALEQGTAAGAQGASPHMLAKPIS